MPTDHQTTSEREFEIVSRSPEGLLAGQIAVLVGRGAMSPSSERETFLKAVAQIKLYGDHRAASPETDEPTPDDGKKLSAICILRWMAGQLLEQRTAGDPEDLAGEAARLLDVAAWLDSTRHPEMRGVGLKEVALG